MRWIDYDSKTCSVARTVEIIGDRWTVLILRDLFNGVTRFDDFARHLGVARDLLAKRLMALVEAGIVQRQPYREPARRTRYEYRLTDAGAELRPALIALMQWGDQHLAGPAGPPMALQHRSCGQPVRLALECDGGHRIHDARELSMTPLSAARRIPSAT
jgi:DNA-binding HxlR family transcriptional regulator